MPTRLFQFGLLALLAASPALADTLTNGRVTVKLATNTQGLGTTNKDRVDFIAWINSKGHSTGNLAANGNSVVCGDPEEFFGQSYDDGDGAGLYMVIYGTVSSWTSASKLAGTSQTNGAATCQGLPSSGRVQTAYTVFTQTQFLNMLRIKRVFVFNAHGKTEPYNMRGYVPRLPIGTYATVLAPDTNGVVQTYSATSCNTACAISSWNGTWFAEDHNGSGMVVLRDASSTQPATVDLDNDAASASNNTSIVLSRPAAGWSANITETEYLCFYDTTTWPAANRAAGKLPQGCAVKVK